MKKIVFSCAACLLALGLVTACGDEVEDDGKVEAGEETYLFGFEVDGVMTYIDGGTVEGYDREGTLTTDVSKAAQISVSNVGNEYFLSFTDGGTTKWITTIVSGSYVNLSYATTESPIYLIKDGDCEYFGNESGTHYLGYYAYYDCLYASEISYLSSEQPAGLYDSTGKLVAGGVGPVATPEEPAPVPTGDSTVKIGVPNYSTATYYYLTATNDSSNGITLTSTWSDAADFYVTSVEGGVTLGTIVNGEGWYIYHYGTSTGLALGNVASSVMTWTIDEETGAIIDPDSGRFIGLQKGYEVVRAYAASNLTSNPYADYYFATTLTTEPSTLEELVPEEFEVVTTPTTGSTYYFGYSVDTLDEEENVESTSYYLFNGTLYQNYALNCSVGSYDAVEVTMTGDGTNGWTLTYEVGEVNYTLYAYTASETNSDETVTIHYDIGSVATSEVSGLDTGSVTAFSWDSTNHGFTVTFGEETDAVTCYVSPYTRYNEITLSVLDESAGATYGYAHLYTLKDSSQSDPA